MVQNYDMQLYEEFREHPVKKHSHERTNELEDEVAGSPLRVHWSVHSFENKAGYSMETLIL